MIERKKGKEEIRYVSEFRRKWLQGRESPDEALLGSGDIQSPADLANSCEVVRSMRPLPFDTILVVRLAILIALPLLPLTLSMVPFHELMERLIKLLL